MDTNVSFDAEKTAPVSLERPEKGIAGALIKTGLVKSRGQANALLIILAILIIVGSAVLYMQTAVDPRVDVPPLPVSTI